MTGRLATDAAREETMAREFKLPDIGEGVHEGEVVKWFVKEGDPVKENDPIVEVMTDKVTVQIPSPVTGKILQLRAKEGEVVKVGSTLIVFGEAGEAVPTRPEAARPTAPPPASARTEAPPAQSRAEFSQSRYSEESSRTFTGYDVAVPWISTSGYSSFEPPVPIDATVNRSTRPLIAPRASCSAGNSEICPFSRSSRKLTLGLREEPVDHPLRIEAADVFVRLSEVDEHDRLPDRLRHRERRTALRVRVDLREDDPVQADGLVKLFRLFDRVVAREGVADVKDQVRFRDALDLLHLVHQVLVRLHPARSVDQDDVPAARPRMLDRVEGDRGGIRSGVVLDQFEADRRGVFLELLDCSRPERVRRGDDTRVAFLHDVVRELRDRRRLAGPIHADEHHDEGTRALLNQAEEVEGRHRQRLRDRIPQGHLDALFEAHLPRDSLPSEVLRKAVHDLLGDRERHIGLEEGDLEVVQDLLELVFLDLAAGVADRLGRHLGFGLLFPAGEPLSERLEHLAPLARCARSL